MKKVQVIIEKSKTGFAAWLPELPGCASTGVTVDQVKRNISEAITYHLEGMKEDRLAIPEEFSSEFLLIFSFDVETFLNYYNHVFTRRAMSRITGVNESLLSQYASGIKRPRPAQSKKIEKGLHQLAQELLQVSL